METEIHEKSDKSSRKTEVMGETELSTFEDSSVSGEEDHSRTIDGVQREKTSNGDCAIGIENDVIDKSSCNENSKAETVCRICHFGSEPAESELILLGCDCKGELGSSHRHCADAWFTQKGNRLCEICGKTAKNISRADVAEEMSIFVMDRNEMRLVAASLNTSRERPSRCKKAMLNFFFTCLVLLFVLPWIFRGMDIL